jgi:hypothetical protein
MVQQTRDEWVQEFRQQHGPSADETFNTVQESAFTRLQGIFTQLHGENPEATLVAVVEERRSEIASECIAELDPTNICSDWSALEDALLDQAIEVERLTGASVNARNQILASAPVAPTDEHETCSICLELLTATEVDGVELGPSLQWPGCDTISSTACHLFHRTCIGEYLMMRSRCPVCRHPL